MIQLLFIILLVEGAIALLLMVKTPLGRVLVKILDLSKRGMGPAVMKTIAATISVILASSSASIWNIRKRSTVIGTITPTDQVLMSRHALEASLMATNDGHSENTPYFDGWKAYDKNPYHPTRNPQGVIQMGLAENQLSFDLIELEDWVNKNPKASIWIAEGVSEFMETANFQDYHGLPAFRNVPNGNFEEGPKPSKLKEYFKSYG